MKREKLQIFLQYLNEQGYHQTFENLQTQTSFFAFYLDINIDSPILGKLIENNEFSKLDQLFDEYAVSRDKKIQCMQIVLKNHYIDLLSQNRISEAVEFLKNYIDEDQKPQLAGLILENVFPVQKNTIINQILILCHQEFGALEPCRLRNIIHQSLANEILECEFHSEMNGGILRKHVCTHRIKQQKKLIRTQQNYINIIDYSKGLEVNVCNTNLIIIDNNQNHRIDTQHTDGILSVSISPCNQFIATASQDKTIRIHEFRKNRSLILQGHTEAVKDVVWQIIQMNGHNGVDIDHYKLLSISVDGWLFEWEKGIKIWSMKTEEKVLKMSVKNQELILVSEFKISIYQNQQLIKQKSFNEPILMVKIDKNHKFLIILKKNFNYRLIYYSLPELTFVKQFFDNNIKSSITSMDIGWLNNRLIVCGTQDGGSIIWHLQKGHQPIKKNEIHNGPILLVSINPHDNKIYYYIDLRQRQIIQLISDDEF